MSIKGESLYDVIGVGRDATKEEIEIACLRLGESYRPDLNKGPTASRRFRELENAYTVLADPVRRAAYDLTLSAARQDGISAASTQRRWTWRLSAAALVAAALIGAFYVWNRGSDRNAGFVARNDSDAGFLAEGAYRALKKLEAATEAGISYTNYRQVLGETWFEVKSYLENPRFKDQTQTRALLSEAMRAYHAAATIWEAKIDAGRDYLQVSGCLDAADCRRGKRLIEDVPGIQTFTDVSGNTKVALDSEVRRQWQIAHERLKAAAHDIR